MEEYRNDFDATRSAGFLCAATVENFEKVGLQVGKLIDSVGGAICRTCMSVFKVAIFIVTLVHC